MALSATNGWAAWARGWRPAGARRRARWSHLLALVLQGEHLHVVQAAHRGGRARVVYRAVLPVEVPGDGGVPEVASLGRAVAGALAGAGLGGGNVVMGVPQGQVMLRVLELPRADSVGELAAMVYLRLGRDLPFRLEEAVIDFQVLRGLSVGGEGVGVGAAGSGEDGQGGVRVLTAVIRRSTLEFYQALAAAAGLRLVALGLRSLAGVEAVLAGHPEVALGSVAVVTMQRREVVFEALLDGALVFSRVAALGVAGEAASSGSIEEMDPLWLEVIRSLHSYEGQEGHRPVGRFLVVGATGREAALADSLNRRFGVPAGVFRAGGEWGEAEGGRDSLPEGLPAVGLALGALAPGGLPVDFLSPKRPPVVRDTRRLRRLAVAALVAALVLGAAGLRARWLGERERVRAGLQEQIRLGSQHLGSFRQVRNQARTLREWTAGGRNWLDHLAFLSALLPSSQEVYVTAVSASARNSLSLAVKVRSGETVDRLTATLRGAGYEVKAPAIMPATDRYSYRFQANLELVVPRAITNNWDALEVEVRPPAGEGKSSPPAPVPGTSPEAPPVQASGSGPGSATAATGSGARVGVGPEAGEGQNRWPRGRRRRPEGGDGD